MNLFALVAVLMATAPDVAQSPVLVDDVAGFGGASVGFAQAGDGVAMLAGGRGGVLLNRHLALGAALFGTPQFMGAGAVPVGDGLLTFWQGGFFVQEQFAPQWVVRPRVGVLVGGAWLQLDGGDAYRALHFMVEPSAGVEVSVTRFLRVGFDVGFRIVPAVPRQLTFMQVSGLSGALTLQFGWF